MSALPMHPTELDRERFRDLTKAMQFGLEYDRFNADGQYKDGVTETAFRAWWSAERERQLLQNLNQSQGCKLSELAQELEAERKRLDWALEHEACFYQWGGVWRLCFNPIGGPCEDDIDTTNPRATIDELIAGEPTGFYAHDMGYARYLEMRK